MTGLRLGIAGLGLIGGSIALRARAAGAYVIGFDIDPNARTSANERGAVDAWTDDLPAIAGAADVLVLALPVDVTAAALETLAHCPAIPLIIDVASVKAPFESFAGRLPSYIGTHPMAGRERGGMEAADPALFEGATWAHVPHADARRVATVRAFIRDLGARPLEIEARHHDAIVALTSHVPQALSVVLAAQLLAGSEADGRVIDLCGPGMMSMLRLARSPAALWSPIVTANAGPLAHELRSFAQALQVVADGLDRGDSSPLLSYFERAHGVVRVLEERFPQAARS